MAGGCGDYACDLPLRNDTALPGMLSPFQQDCRVGRCGKD